MPDNLEYMLQGDVQQLRWVPRAYGDVLLTYQSSSDQEPPLLLMIYHGDGDGNTAVYNFLLTDYTNSVEEGDDVFLTSRVKKHIVLNTVPGNPWETETKKRLWAKCQHGFDAIHMDLDRALDHELIIHISAFASLYFIYAYYDSVPGVERADEYVRAAPEGTTKLPTQPYGGELEPKEPQENNVLQFPTKLRLVKDDE